MYAACLTHLIFDFIALIIFGEEYGHHKAPHYVFVSILLFAPSQVPLMSVLPTG
jgi:hypothetical protein